MNNEELLKEWFTIVYDILKKSGQHGFNNSETYYDFLKSGYTTKKDYEEFKLKEKISKDLGYESIKDYEKSQELGFNDANIYYDFLKSGCKTKQEYEFFKKLPNLFNKIDDKINEIIKDANDAYNSQRYEEFIRLKFLTIEKISEKLNLLLFKKELEIDNELKIDDIISLFEEKLNEQLVITKN